MPLMLLIGVNLLTNYKPSTGFELFNYVISLLLGAAYIAFFCFAVHFTFNLYPKHYSNMKHSFEKEGGKKETTENEGSTDSLGTD